MASVVLRVSRDLKRKVDKERGTMSSAEYLDSIINEAPIAEPWATIYALSNKIDVILERLD